MPELQQTSNGPNLITLGDSHLRISHWLKDRLNDKTTTLFLVIFLIYCLSVTFIEQVFASVFVNKVFRQRKDFI